MARKIAVLEGEDLRYLMDMLGPGSTGVNLKAYRLRIEIRQGGLVEGLVFKVNEGTWSPTVGRLEEAQ